MDAEESPPLAVDPAVAGSGVTAPAAPSAATSGALVVRERPKGARLLPPLSCGRPRLVKGRRVLGAGSEAAGGGGPAAAAEGGGAEVVVEVESPPLPRFAPKRPLRPPNRFGREKGAGGELLLRLVSAAGAAVVEEVGLDPSSDGDEEEAVSVEPPKRPGLRKRFEGCRRLLFSEGAGRV